VEETVAEVGTNKTGSAGNDNTQFSSNAHSSGGAATSHATFKARLMTEAMWLERAALLAVIVVSLGLFWVRFRKVLDVIRRARATPDFTVAPVGPRIRQFLWEVLAQGKVIQQRPLAGVAHGFVFWGFCAFGLITLNDVASGFGWRFLTPASAFGRFYFEFVALWAVLVAISIVGLFVRRFILRPKWLGPVSAESGFIALLIFTLMVTYVAGLRLPEESAAGKVNWWLHTLGLAIFLPL